MPVAAQESRLAQRAIRTSPIHLLRGIDVIETDSEVIIRGQLHSFYLKQLAQEAVLPVLNGRRLINEIVVETE